MYNYMLPQSNVNSHQEKLEKYLFDTVDVNVNFMNNMIDSFDKFSGHTFTTYSSRVKNLVGSTVENAKEVIRTGTIKYPQG